MDQKGCEELRMQEENLDTLMWFKLLVVPSLGIIILTLFLLEDYCYSFENKSKELTEEVEENDITISKRKKNTFWGRRGHRDKKSVEVLRINLVDENGNGNCYKIDQTLSMRDILKFHCQRNRASPDAVILRHEGKKISLNETPEKLGLQDLAVVDVETGYYKLFEDYRKESEVQRSKLEKQLQESKKSRLKTEESIDKAEAQLKDMLKSRRDMEKELNRLEAEKVQLTSGLTKVEGDLKKHREARKLAEAARNKAEKELDQDKDRKERKRLEKAIKNLSVDIEAKEKLIVLAQQEQREQVKTRTALKDRLSDCISREETLEREIKGWRAKATQASALTDKMDKLERIKADIVKWSARSKEQEQEAAQLAKDLEVWRAKANAVEAASKESARLKGRCKSVEKETKALKELKNNLEKHYPNSKDNHRKYESNRQRLEELKKRNKDLEVELQQIQLLRQKAKVLSQEVKAEKDWKRTYLDQLAKNSQSQLQRNSREQTGREVSLNGGRKNSSNNKSTTKSPSKDLLRGYNRRPNGNGVSVSVHSVSGVPGANASTFIPGRTSHIANNLSGHQSSHNHSSTHHTLTPSNPHALSSSMSVVPGTALPGVSGVSGVPVSSGLSGSMRSGGIGPISQSLIHPTPQHSQPPAAGLNGLREQGSSSSNGQSGGGIFSHGNEFLSTPMFRIVDDQPSSLRLIDDNANASVGAVGSTPSSGGNNSGNSVLDLGLNRPLLIIDDDSNRGGGSSGNQMNLSRLFA